MKEMIGMALENSLTDNTPGIHARWASSTHLWTALRVILAITVNVALLAAIAMPIRSYISPPGPHTPWFAWCVALTWQPVMALQALFFFRWVDRRPLRELPLGFGRRARSAALWGAVLSIGLMAAYIGLTELGGLATWHWNAGFAPAATVLTALLTAMAGLGEELLFRGYLLRTLSH
jgi:membrane protease YdiL (CAAX protease family)